MRGETCFPAGNLDSTENRRFKSQIKRESLARKCKFLSPKPGSMVALGSFTISEDSLTGFCR